MSDPGQPKGKVVKNMAKNDFSNCAHIISSAYLVVLVRRDRNERRFGEHMSAEGGVFGAEPVIFIRLYNVDPRLVFMHRVQNDLKGKKRNKKNPIKAAKAVKLKCAIGCVTVFSVKNQRRRRKSLAQVYTSNAFIQSAKLKNKRKTNARACTMLVFYFSFFPPTVLLRYPNTLAFIWLLGLFVLLFFCFDLL